MEEHALGSGVAAARHAEPLHVVHGRVQRQLVLGLGLPSLVLRLQRSTDRVEGLLGLHGEGIDAALHAGRSRSPARGAPAVLAWRSSAARAGESPASGIGQLLEASSPSATRAPKMRGFRGHWSHCMVEGTRTRRNSAAVTSRCAHGDTLTMSGGSTPMLRQSTIATTVVLRRSFCLHCGTKGTRGVDKWPRGCEALRGRGRRA